MGGASAKATTNLVDYDAVKAKAEKRFLVIDKLHPDIRAIVHEYGWAPVRLLLELGVRKPGHLREIILTCRHGRA